MYSKTLISGRLVEPADDKPRSGVTLTLSSVKNSSVVLKHATYRCVTGGNGEYSFMAAPGAYAVAVSVYGAEPERVGQISVYADSSPGDLNTFLMSPGEDDLTPEIIRLVDSMRGEAVKAAESAKVSEQIVTQSASDVAEHAQQVASDKVVVAQKNTIATDAAATAVAAKEQASKDAVATGKDRQVTQTKAQEAAASANAAKAAQDSIVEDAADVRDKALQVADNTALVANNAAAVQLNTDQVVQHTQTVSVKAQQVSENTQSVAVNTLSVTKMRDAVVAKTGMAQAAADTATQKAASAAEHDAAAAEYARQAQEAAQATAGALIDGGAADLSTGVYPQPVQVSGTARPTFWKVTKGGTVGDVDYGVGDTLIYTVAGSGSYYKIDNTESVTSVQGEKGAVTLTPEKIGADPAGTAFAGMQQHVNKASVHPISGVAGLQAALAEKLDASAVSVFGKNLIGDQDAAAARTRLGLGTAATKSTGVNHGNVLAIGELGFGGNSIAIPGGNHNNAKQSGAYGFSISDINAPMESATGNVFAQTWGIDPRWRTELAISVSVNRMFFRSILADQTGATQWVEVRHSGNTTVDANGFIKNASPIVRVGATEIYNDSDALCGAGVANREAIGVTVEKVGVGGYKIIGSLGFAKDGWYIETPNDANGNKLRFVEYEYRNGIIELRTFEPNYSSGRCEAGEPADIPCGRWIDVRLEMPDAGSAASNEFFA